jgi:hypothetical protein
VSREGWDYVGGIVALVLVALVGFGLYEAAVTSVSVPLLLPLAMGAGVVWLGWREADAWTQRRREAIERYERQRAELRHPPRDEQAVTLILHRGPYESDLDPRRIGDAERDVVVAALHEHFSAGRLDREEIETRISLALGAKTVGELRRLVMDLPNGDLR